MTTTHANTARLARSVMAALIAVGGCSEEPGPSTTEPTADLGEATRTIAIGELTATVPESWQSSPQDQVDRLVESAKRNDRAAGVAVVGVSAQDDQTAPSVTLTSIHQSRRHTGPMTVEQAVQRMRIGVERGAAERDAAPTFSSRCGTRHCDVSWGMTSEEVRIDNRIRFWKREGGLVSSSCACIDEACAAIDTCTLPPPPDDAEPVAGSPPG